MKINLLKLSLLLVFLLQLGTSGKAQNNGDLPEIVAEGDQFYCAQSTINVVTDFFISGPSDLEISAFYIQISSGYKNGDVLQLVAGGNGIIDSWDPLTGKLTLSKQGSFLTYQEVIDAVKKIVYTGNDPDFKGEKYFSFTLGNANFLPSTGHFYEYVRDVGVTWTQARALAEQMTYFGLEGYLATITSPEEAQLSGEQAEGTGWIGGSDAELEGTWKWVTGPEAGMVFWLGDFNGYAPDGAFEFWNNGEPNNQGGEDYAHVTAPNVGITGSWNDLSNTGANSGNYQPKGYIVEYGYDGPDEAPIFSAFTRIYTNTIDSTFSGQRCGPGIVELRATTDIIEDQPEVTEILWFDSLQGTSPVHKGETFSPDLNTSQDFYVLASQNDCFEGKRVQVSATVFDIPIIEKEVTLKNCDQDDDPTDGFTDFNLEEANELIYGLDPTGLNFTYYLTAEEAEQDINRLDPFPFNNSLASMVFGRVETSEGCFDIATVFLEVSATQPVDVVNLESCDTDGNNDGFFNFDLTAATDLILNQLPPQNLRVQYYRSLDEAILEQNEILPQDNFTNESPYYQALFVRVESEDNGECISLGEFAALYVFPLPEFEVIPEVIYCQNLPPIEVTIQNAQGSYTYEWKDPSGLVISTSDKASISSGGVYSVTATSNVDCVSTVRNFNVMESSVAEITQADIKVIDGGEENSILIDPTNLGVGDYVYALDDPNGPYQESPFFDNVNPGIHTVFVKDINECGITSIEVSVIGYPKFFTPNGDGYNDTWQVKGVSFQPESLIYIFDKFGKLLAKIEANGEGWDGVFKGKQMPSSDYWYKVQLQDGRIHTGHFSLIRR